MTAMNKLVFAAFTLLSFGFLFNTPSTAVVHFKVSCMWTQGPQKQSVCHRLDNKLSLDSEGNNVLDDVTSVAAAQVLLLLLIL